MAQPIQVSTFKESKRIKREDINIEQVTSQHIHNIIDRYIMQCSMRGEHGAKELERIGKMVQGLAKDLRENVFA